MREEAGSEPLDERSRPTSSWSSAPAPTTARSQLELYVNVRNLLGEHDIVSRRPFGARPNAPRWILGGVKFRL